MANSDQKTILLEQAYEELKEIRTKFQNESGATDMEVKTLLRELARVYEKWYWWQLWHRLGSLNKFIWYSFAMNWLRPNLNE